MPRVKENEGLINLKLPKELKYAIKIQALKEQTTMQKFMIKVVKDYLKDKEGKSVKFNIDGEEFVIEPATKEDMPVFERGIREYARGEYSEIRDEEELDDEDNNNEINQKRL
jgi:hypothetical protein